MSNINNRNFIIQTAVCTSGVTLGLYSCSKNNSELLSGVQDFINQVENIDGSLRPGIDPD